MNDGSTDIQVLLDVLKYMQKIGTQQPFASDVDVQTTPATDSGSQSDDALITYVVPDFLWLSLLTVALSSYIRSTAAVSIYVIVGIQYILTYDYRGATI